MSMLTTVEIDVFRSDDQSVIPSAHCLFIDIANPTSRYEGYTDSAGRWLVPELVWPSQYSLIVEKEGYDTYDEIVGVGGGSIILPVALVPTAWVEATRS